MKRIIKNEFLEYKNFNSKNMEIVQIGENTQRIHPITLNWIDNSKSSTPLCLTKPSFEKDNLTIYKEKEARNIHKVIPDTGSSSCPSTHNNQ